MTIDHKKTLKPKLSKNTVSKFLKVKAFAFVKRLSKTRIIGGESHINSFTLTFKSLIW